LLFYFTFYILLFFIFIYSLFIFTFFICYLFLFLLYNIWFLWKLFRIITKHLNDLNLIRITLALLSLWFFSHSEFGEFRLHLLLATVHLTLQILWSTFFGWPIRKISFFWLTNHIINTYTYNTYHKYLKAFISLNRLYLLSLNFHSFHQIYIAWRDYIIIFSNNVIKVIATRKLNWQYSSLFTLIK